MIVQYNYIKEQRDAWIPSARTTWTTSDPKQVRYFLFAPFLPFLFLFVDLGEL